MALEKKIKKAQSLLKKEGLDGWLLYDFRRNNPLACHFLEVPEERMLTRRFFYWIPSNGEATRICSCIEQGVLGHLPGNLCTYSSRQELEKELKALLAGRRCVAMEYSPQNALPYVSMVDAGTIEWIRGFGVDVLSSADLLQHFSSLLSEQQANSHRFAAFVLQEIVEAAWRWIAEKMRLGQRVDEYQVKVFIQDQIAEKGCCHEGGPIVAVNAHAADPHYVPIQSGCAEIKKGDLVLIDLWCKGCGEEDIYADICRMGVVGEPSDEQAAIFSIVKEAQQAALSLVKERFEQGLALQGWEVDQRARELIEAAGYGSYFTHRTGHNIHCSDHGPGTHLDNFETRDTRQILPASCFSIEPGIYLPDKFGIRLETDIYISPEGEVEVTGGLQEELVLIS